MRAATIKQRVAIALAMCLLGAAAVATVGATTAADAGAAFVFAVRDSPTVSSISPAFSLTTGGMAVTITGTGFVANGLDVTIGGTAATNVTFVDATTVTAATPAHSAGVVDVVVTTVGGSGTLTNGFTYVAPSPTAQQAYLKASNTGTADWFGYNVAVSGDTVVVGAPHEDSLATGIDGDDTNNSAPDAGAAYVFVRSGGVWSQQAYLKASNTGANNFFGSSVALSGDTLVVGAPGEEGFGNDGNNNGAVYVFVRSGGVWTQQRLLRAPNSDVGDQFGSSVSVSGDTLVVGAPTESSAAIGVNGDGTNNSAPNAGAAYVFVRSGDVWNPQAYLKASNTGNGDQFGWSVAVSGDTVVVGAFQEDSAATGVDGDGTDNSAANAGAAYVFVRSAGAWSQQAYLKASNSDAGDAFGVSVAISGDTVVVGAWLEDSAATGVNGDGTNNSAPDAGAAYVFVRSDGNWSQQAYLKASNNLNGAGAWFGYSVAVSGDTLVVGASIDNEARAGAAYAFVRRGGAWSQQAYLTASNPWNGAHFGDSVALSGDTVVAGAPDEPSAATGVDGDGTNNGALESGAAYVFHFTPAPPSVTSIAPTAGPIAGGTSVTIRGTNFIADGLAVTIGGTAATNVTFVDATTVTATTPAHAAGGADVVVATVYGDGTLTSGFTYVAVPTVTSISPTSGPSAGGTSVTITGTNFATNGLSVAMGGIAATSVTFVNATTVTATAPAHVAGSANIVVMTAGGTGALTNGFLYVAAPMVSSITPVAGSTGGGTAVTITGANFSTIGLSVTIGGSAAVGVVFANASTITAITPAHATGVADVVVTTVGGAATLPGGFTYYTSLFTDDPIQSGVTRLKGVHIAELRGYVDALRGRYSLSAMSWTDPSIAAGTTPIKTVHIAELRSALAQVYAARGEAAPTFTDPVLTTSTPIKGAHITELRAAIAVIY